jgi:hypothetical protein
LEARHNKILSSGKREGNRHRFRGSSSRIAAADDFGGRGGGKDRRRRFRWFLPRVQPAGRIFNMLVKNAVRISGSERIISVFSSVADPGCLSRIPDPDFYPSQIPDPKTAAKERSEEKKFVVIPFFVATNVT